MRISDGPVVEGSVGQRRRIETFQALILRGGNISSQVTWTKNLTVVRCEPNHSLDFETKNLYNGLSVGFEFVSFRLLSASSGTVLVMTDKKRPHFPGPFHVFIVGLDILKPWIARPLVGVLFRLFPDLRVNDRLRRIKTAVEKG